MFNRIKPARSHSSYNVEVKQEGGLNQPRSSPVSVDTSSGRSASPCVLSAVHLFICHVMFPLHRAAPHRWLTLYSWIYPLPKCRVCPNQLTDLQRFPWFYIVVGFFGQLALFCFHKLQKCHATSRFIFIKKDRNSKRK